MSDTRFDRQVLAFGPEGQAQIEKQRVGIVGLGGLGSHVSQALVYLGVSRFALIDPDCVEWSNLNRLIGATPEDAKERRLKVDVARRLILSVCPDAEISIGGDLRTRAALHELKECDVIFGAVDNDGARLVITELAAAYEMLYIDSATDFPATGVDELHFGGRVVVARPGRLCLLCAREIDPEVAKIELEPLETRAIRDRHGYGLGPAVPSPAVVSLNGVVANAAVTEYICHITGLREPYEGLHFLGHAGKLKPRIYSRDSAECYTCNVIRGQRDDAQIERFAI